MAHLHARGGRGRSSSRYRGRLQQGREPNSGANSSTAPPLKLTPATEADGASRPMRRCSVLTSRRRRTRCCSGAGPPRVDALNDQCENANRQEGHKGKVGGQIHLAGHLSDGSASGERQSQEGARGAEQDDGDYPEHAPDSHSHRFSLRAPIHRQKLSVAIADAISAKATRTGTVKTITVSNVSSETSR